MCQWKRWGCTVAKKKESKKVKKVMITQVRSGIGRQRGHRRTIEALGIKRHQQSVMHEVTPALEGMLRKVSFMVEVTEVKDS